MMSAARAFVLLGLICTAQAALVYTRTRAAFDAALSATTRNLDFDLNVLSAKPFLVDACDPGFDECYACSTAPGYGAVFSSGTLDVTVEPVAGTSSNYLCVITKDWSVSNTFDFVGPNALINNGPDTNKFIFSTLQQAVGFYLLTNDQAATEAITVYYEDSTTETVFGSALSPPLPNEAEEQFVGIVSSDKKIMRVDILPTNGQNRNAGVQRLAVLNCDPELSALVASPTTVAAGASVTVSTSLTAADAPATTAVVGETITFSAPAETDQQSITDASGQASATFEFSVAQYPSVVVTATYAATECSAAQSTTVTVFITCSPTLSAMTLPASALAGSSVTATATVVDATNSNAPIPGVVVTFTPTGAGAAGSSSQTATTDANGVATTSFVFNGNGPAAVTATVTACGTAAAPISLPTTVYSFAGAGAFVIGNSPSVNAETFAYFWGSQWGKNNAVTGTGKIPSAFKGFASSYSPATNPTSFSASPGNSVTPPATLPDYMGVLVTSQFFTGPSSITGDVVGVVIVRTESGYGPNPGHAGTGPVYQIVSP